MPSDQERLESLNRAAAKANQIGFVAILTRDLRWLLEQVASPRRKLDFCVACGAHIPPRDGEGTCPVCDPIHSGKTSEELADDAERN